MVDVILELFIQGNCTVGGQWLDGEEIVFVFPLLFHLDEMDQSGSFDGTRKEMLFHQFDVDILLGEDGVGLQVGEHVLKRLVADGLFIYLGQVAEQELLFGVQCTEFLVVLLDVFVDGGVVFLFHIDHVIDAGGERQVEIEGQSSADDVVAWDFLVAFGLFVLGVFHY